MKILTWKKNIIKQAEISYDGVEILPTIIRIKLELYMLMMNQKKMEKCFISEAQKRLALRTLQKDSQDIPSAISSVIGAIQSVTPYQKLDRDLTIPPVEVFPADKGKDIGVTIFPKPSLDIPDVDSIPATERENNVIIENPPYIPKSIIDIFPEHVNEGDTIIRMDGGNGGSGQLFSNTETAKLLDDMPELSGTNREKLLSVIQDKDLWKEANELYRPGGKIGDGGTAAILRDEYINGNSRHLQKAMERLNNLKDIAKSSNLGLNDLEIIEALIIDLEDAISLFK